jgi:hypothetical protein
LDFFGPERPSVRAAAAGAAIDPDAKAGSTTDAMNWVKKRATRFCEPGEQSVLPGTDVKVYVLGPPKDKKMLAKDAPSKGKDEAYELRADRLSLSAALDRFAANADGMPDDDIDAPFESRFVVSRHEACYDPFFCEHYGFDTDPLNEAGEAWRRIDLAWLDGASRLALKLDSDTNNTSLALAFELPDGRTLIFPGDAQIGNWLSWQDVKFKDEKGQELKVTSEQLLQRATFYKVGHHGSHNATLKAGGLESMTSGNLVAMIPVDQNMAATKKPPKTGWKMPFHPLYAELNRRTGYRVLRADRDEAALDETVKELAKSNPAESEQLQEFRTKNVEFAETLLVADPKETDLHQPLYIEYTLPTK